MSPPENRFIRNQIIQPGFTKEIIRRFFIKTGIRQSTDKCQCAGNIIIGNNQRFIAIFMNIPGDCPPFFLNPLFRPAFEWSSEINPDYFSENSGINLLFVTSAFKTVDITGQVFHSAVSLNLIRTIHCFFICQVFYPTDNDVRTEKTPFWGLFPLDFWLVWDGFSFGERGIAFLFFFYQNNFEVVRLQ